MDYPKSVPSAGLMNGKFVDENPLTGTPGSLIPADWGNGVTEEIVNVIKAGDLTPDETKNDQLLLAMQNVAAKGWNLDMALPLTALPLPTIASADGRMAVTPSAVATGGGKVSIPGGVFVSIGQEVVAGQLGRSRTFSTTAWSSGELLALTSYFLRAQVTGNVLTYYMQRGTIYDAVAEGLKGTANAFAGGGFQSTPLDMCIAWVFTGAPGSMPVIRTIYNRNRLSWTQTVNGNGVVYLPLDPHARAARLVVGNPIPHPTVATSVAFAPGGWLGGNYSFLNPNNTVSAGWSGWSTPNDACRIMTNFLNDTTISTLTASFEHVQGRSLWQVYQAEHSFGALVADSDELLLGMGVKAFSQSDYTNGIAINFYEAVNVHFSWELIR